MGDDPPSPPIDDRPPPPRCVQCRAWALKRVDPDGVRRCHGHSIDPENIAKREREAQAGRLAGEHLKGIPYAKRALAAALGDAARPLLAPAPIVDLKPVALRTKQDVIAWAERLAARHEAGEDAKRTSAAASLLNVAWRMVGGDEGTGDKAEGPKSFSFKTPEGATVTLKSRVDTETN
jgi:hypothetical protein